MNNTGISTHIQESYLFTKKGSIWGWASWKRVLDTWDEKYTWLKNKKKLALIRSRMKRKEYNIFVKTAKRHFLSGRAHYESINAAAMYLSDSLNIVPKYNMISNIGVAKESTHSVGDIRLLPKRIQRLFHMRRYEIEFPLMSPKEIKRDEYFEKKMTFTKSQMFFAKIEHLLRVWKYQGFKELLKKIKKKLQERENV
ncbi:MAG: hypothetical protein J6A63_07325 [Clostridia bacterium]|nr:hypothetical protein [Clostridia bacterium]